MTYMFPDEGEYALILACFVLWDVNLLKWCNSDS